MIDNDSHSVAAELLRNLRSAQARLDEIAELAACSARLSVVVQEVEDWTADRLIEQRD